MKLKITAALLACFMLLASLAACGNNDDNNGDDTSGSGNIPVLNPPDQTTTESTDTTTAEPTETTEDPAQTTTEPPVVSTEPPVITTEPPVVTTEPTVDETTFTACDETVYVLADALNLRTAPTMGDNVYNQVLKGTSLRRVGYNEVWSKVIHEEKEYYVSSKYVSAEDPNAEVVFTARYETVYITADYLNIRVNPSTTADIYSTVTKGTEVIRIGYSDDWSKIMYEGNILYAGSKYLSTEKPGTEAPAETTAANP